MREASGGVGCVYGWWAHMRHNASQRLQSYFLNKRVAIAFS
jgi:hypothetical protein